MCLLLRLQDCTCLSEDNRLEVSAIVLSVTELPDARNCLPESPIQGNPIQMLGWFVDRDLFLSIDEGDTLSSWIGFHGDSLLMDVT